MQEKTYAYIGLTGGELTIDWDKKVLIYNPKIILGSKDADVEIPFQNIVSAEKKGNPIIGFMGTYGDFTYVEVTYKVSESSEKKIHFIPGTKNYKNVFAVGEWANKIQKIADENKGKAAAEIKGLDTLVAHERSESSSYKGIALAIVAFFVITVCPIIALVICYFAFYIVVTLSKTM